MQTSVLRSRPSPRLLILTSIFLAILVLAGITFHPYREQPRVDPLWRWGTHREDAKEGETWSFREPPSRFLHNALAANASGDALCANFPTYLLQRVQIVLKTGVGERDGPRVRANTASVTRCITNLLVISDLDFPLGAWRAHDVVGPLAAAGRVTQADRAVYEEQRRAFAAGGVARSKDGWRLDRYKFLPMVERARDASPAARWLVFLEADTYVVWDNLFRLLDGFDPARPHYFGSAAPGRRPSDEEPSVWFAYGGTGIVLSAAAADALLAREAGAQGEFARPPVSGQFEQLVRDDCCGDSVLGFVLWLKGVALQGLWPMFSPHPVRVVPLNGIYWCKPVISMHRMLPEEMERLWEWEQFRDRERPLLYADFFEFGRVAENATRKNWENTVLDRIEPREPAAHDSFDACGEACLKDDRCFQYNYHLKKCTLSKSIMVGSHKEPEGDGTDEEKRFMAGWDVEKVMKWKDSHPCKKATWVKPSLERVF